MPVSRRAAAIGGVIAAMACLAASTARADDTGRVAEQEAFPIRVVAYNVWGVPHITPDRPERIAAIAAHLATLEASVVALQEVWLDEDAAVIGAKLVEAGLVHQHYFGPGEMSPKGSGLWIGSRYPIEEVRFERFSVGEKVYIPWHLDWMAQKGVAIARLRTPAGVVDVANSHFQSSYFSAGYGFVQLAQARQTADALAPRERDEAAPPLIVAGDFNAVPDSLPHRILTARASLEPAAHDFQIDAVMARQGEGRALHAMRVDRQLTEPVMLADRVERFLSDHPCIVVDYELRTCPGCAVPPPKHWRAVAAEALGALRDEMVETERFMFAGRVLCVALPLGAVWSGRRALRRIPRRARMIYASLAAMLLTLGTWLGYVGWDFGPYKLDVLAAQAQFLRTGS